MKRERGTSVWQILGMGTVLGAVGFILLKLYPPVWDYYRAAKIVKELERHTTGASPADIRKRFASEVQAKKLATVPPEALDVSKDGGALVLTLQYETITPLVSNISVAIGFDSTPAQPQ